MADKPINLNRARKDRARDARRKKADENAVKFGRTKAEKAHDRQSAEHEAARLDGHRREDQPE